MKYPALVMMFLLGASLAQAAQLQKLDPAEASKAIRLLEPGKPLVTWISHSGGDQPALYVIRRAQLVSVPGPGAWTQDPAFEVHVHGVLTAKRRGRAWRLTPRTKETTIVLDLAYTYLPVGRRTRRNTQRFKNMARGLRIGANVRHSVIEVSKDAMNACRKRRGPPQPFDRITRTVFRPSAHAPLETGDREDVVIRSDGLVVITRVEARGLSGKATQRDMERLRTAIAEAKLSEVPHLDTAADVLRRKANLVQLRVDAPGKSNDAFINMEQAAYGRYRARLLPVLNAIDAIVARLLHESDRSDTGRAIEVMRHDVNNLLADWVKEGREDEDLLGRLPPDSAYPTVRRERAGLLNQLEGTKRTSAVPADETNEAETWDDGEWIDLEDKPLRVRRLKNGRVVIDLPPGE